MEIQYLYVEVKEGEEVDPPEKNGKQPSQNWKETITVAKLDLENIASVLNRYGKRGWQLVEKKEEDGEIVKLLFSRPRTNLGGELVLEFATRLNDLKIQIENHFTFKLSDRLSSLRKDIEKDIAEQLKELKEDIRDEMKVRMSAHSAQTTAQTTIANRDRNAQAIKQLQSVEAMEAAMVKAAAEIIPEMRDFTFETVRVNDRAEEIDRQPMRARLFVEELGDGIGIEMVEIPGGTFLMGSPEDEKERLDFEGPKHEVAVQTFFLGKYPVTQEQWETVMGSNPSEFKGKKRPVEKVSWHDRHGVLRSPVPKN